MERTRLSIEEREHRTRWVRQWRKRTNGQRARGRRRRRRRRQGATRASSIVKKYNERGLRKPPYCTRGRHHQRQLRPLLLLAHCISLPHRRKPALRADAQPEKYQPTSPQLSWPTYCPSATDRDRAGLPPISTSTASFTRLLSSSTVSSYTASACHLCGALSNPYLAVLRRYQPKHNRLVHRKMLQWLEVPRPIRVIFKLKSFTPSTYLNHVLSPLT